MESALDPRHDAAEGDLAGAERLRADVLAIHREQIERDEEPPLPPEQEVLEVARAVRVQAPDFPSRMAECALTADFKIWNIGSQACSHWATTGMLIWGERCRRIYRSEFEPFRSR